MVAAVGLLLAHVTVKPWLPHLARLRRPLAKAGVHPPAEGLRPALEREAGAKAYRKVAVALDFSGRDAAIVSEALKVVGGVEPELALMHVVESASARFLGNDSADEETQEDARRLEEYAGQLRAMGYEVRTYLGAGKPVPELVRMIEEYQPDLVVLGAHGHRFFSDLLFGSTADSLRHRIKASVLVVAKDKY